MKPYTKYLSKCLAAFAGVVLLLLVSNLLAFGGTFCGMIAEDYGTFSPARMLDNISAQASPDGIARAAAGQLRDAQIWAVYLDETGKVLWKENAPDEIPDSFSVPDVAAFAKGYLADYPVFIRNTDGGMLVLGYPKGSYTKLPGNYLSTRSVRMLPLFAAAVLAFDLAALFSAYFYSRRKIVRSTEPVIASIEMLGNGNPAALTLRGELAGVAESLNRASQVITRQNQARANWISGVSHDIRTPLSMIMGYAELIANDSAVNGDIRKKAEIIGRQSVQIRELVQDLNLVSQLEYEMQPIHKATIRIASLVRTYVADLLNGGLPDQYSIDVDISANAEITTFECDARLISRAINNLVQNSIQHNPDGCDIMLSLDCTEDSVILYVADNGIGLSAEKIKELRERPHYIESTDDRLDLRHGLGHILVQQIVKAHNGTMQVESENQKGFKVMLIFPRRPDNPCM